MNLGAFLCLILVLLAGWLQVYSASRHLFNGVGDIKEEIAHLKHTAEEEKLIVALEREQFLEFRQHVATLMPDVLKEKGLGEEGYAYRNLASTIGRSEADKVRSSIAKTLFERGRGYFREKKYEKASTTFKQIIDHYSFTPVATESLFLLVECYFQQNELEKSIKIIQQMVELFPQHELTGFAMIRLGRIYELQDRHDEAIEIYKTVIRSYPQREVASQAKASLKGVD